ncbi:hypothetical protein VB796_17645 [Arcicella sp. LKC2W]|uniref:hypothetical protein n=1 Tax=Arcicella sp. LKC2W TaxID=2984198 RepID=UPI002B21AF08|nr:hypothetical protein [Arcicella sp. LKC2W]MEA5460888.1 hypothetical protein [Arcicella sp. LKC2W]
MAKLNLRDSIKAKAQSTISNGLINTENIKKKIIIVDELNELIKPLQEDEYEQLKANILQNGCQDTIKIWQTFEKVINPNHESDEEIFVLVDGHNRFKICQENQIPYNISILNFETLEDAKSFMIDLQLGRRNVNPIEISYYRGLQYNRFKWVGLEQNSEEDSKKTAVAIGEQYNVDERTIRRDGQFAEGLEMLTKELKNEVLEGKVKISKKDLQKLSKLKSSNLVENEIVKKIETVKELDDLINPIKFEESKKTINSTVATSARNILNEFLHTPTLENFTELEKVLKDLKNLVS